MFFGIRGGDENSTRWGILVKKKRECGIAIPYSRPWCQRNNTCMQVTRNLISYLPGYPLSISIAGCGLKSLTISTRSDRWASVKSSSRKSKLLYPKRQFCLIHLNSFLGVVHFSKVPAGIWFSSNNFKLSSCSSSISCESRSKSLWKGSKKGSKKALKLGREFTLE